MAKSPPPLRHLYPRITSFPTLLAAYRARARAGGATEGDGLLQH
jgi:hypothetical protein